MDVRGSSESDDVDDETHVAAHHAEASYASFCNAAILNAARRAELWTDSKSFVDTRARSPPATLIRALAGSRAATCAKAARAFLNEHFESGPRDRTRTPELSDWREDVGMTREAACAESRAFATHVHGLWRVLARLDADDEEEATETETPIAVVSGDGLSSPENAEAARADETVKRTTSSRIRLPFPAVVPGERFRETYYWDTYWIVLGLLASEMHATAKGVTNNLLHMVNTYGFVPNGARVYYLNRSQPPLLTSCVAVVYDATKDLAWLRQSLPMLVQEYAYLTRPERIINVRDPETGEIHALARYFANTTRPRPESYREDVELARRATKNIRDGVEKLEAKRTIYRHLASAAESGYDFSSRWFLDGDTLETIRTCDIIPADLNGFMLRVESEIVYLAREILVTIKPEDELYAERLYLTQVLEKFSHAADARRRAINAVLWDDDVKRWRDMAFKPRQAEDARAIYRDVCDLKPASQSPFTSDFTPLWCGAADRDSERAYEVVRALKESKLVTENGIATSRIESGQQWDWPNAWAPTTHMIVEAIQIFAPKEEAYAKTLAHAWIRTAHAAWKETGYMHEKYDVRADVHGVGGGGEYVPQRGFGWTNGVTLRLMSQYGFPCGDER